MSAVKIANLVIFYCSTKYFVWDSKSMTFSAEISDLYSSPLVTNTKALRLQRVNPDNFDLGIALQSQETGKVEMFKLVETNRVEGDTMFWRFKAINPKIHNVAVIIFND